jgi:branched-chain amino acid transport system substrate-binding protein
VFQINLTPNVQGRVLAAVTKDSLHAVTVAILASSDASDAALVSEFVRALRNSRVKIIANETFAPGTTDLTRQLTRIRRAALSLVPLPPDVDTVRSMPEVSIDVMLVCSSRETDLISVAAQIPTQKIWTRIVGNASWGSPSVRLQAGEAAEGVVFATTYDFSYREAREFAQAYQMARGSESSIVTALSYDAASLALQAISTGARNRSQVREFLGNVQNWPGVTGMITFSPDGCNGEAMVRMIRGGRVQPVSDWQLLAAQQPQSE